MIDTVAMARRVRRRILELGLGAGKNGSHQGSGLSIVDLICVLYGGELKITGDGTNDPRRDRFILSKGHAAVALYAVLEELGILTREETSTFEQNGTSFYAHAHRDLAKGIEFSGGSLSLGLSFGVGVALSCQRHGLENRVVVLVGDGECDEGLVWESAMAAANFKLGNLTVIVDCNGMQSDGKKAEIMDHGSIAAKFAAFGFNICEIDGHSHPEVQEALRLPRTSSPHAIIARTVKGKGISFMEGNPDWHYGIVTPALYAAAIAELEATA